VVFKTNSAQLSDEAQKRLTELADKLKAEDRNVYIEIQGHGDIRGSNAHNRALGERRAEAVREFLADQGVPLPRMTTISYGKERPKSAKATSAAHAQNRRVVVIVMG
jgi:outer membrane protein OmpA-like peptidoglycan-associated protein